MKDKNLSANDKEKGYDRILFDLFRSLKLTITLLILLAIFSIIGTVITQNATPEDYIRRYGHSLYEVFDFFSLFDMYHSWWFSVLLLLFVVNLITCSVHRFPGVWNQFFRKSGTGVLEDSMVKTLPFAERISLPEIDRSHYEKELQTLVKKEFPRLKRIESESAVSLFGEKGKFSRLGVYVAHLSLVIILIGGLMGSLFGFRGFVNIFEGETVHQIYLRTKDKATARDIPFSVRCDAFQIAFHDVPGQKQRYVKAYTSDLAILENGKEVLKKTIQVNHPLHYKGLTFYQSSYGSHQEATVGFLGKDGREKTFLTIHEGETLRIPNTDVLIRMIRYLPQTHNLGEGLQMVLLRQNQPPQPLWVFRDPSRMESQKGEFRFSFEGIRDRAYTGLQVTRDPGVWVVWAGCALLILGFILSFFFSHQRVWVRFPRHSGKEMVLAGSASKNRIGFEKTFQRLTQEVRAIKK